MNISETAFVANAWTKGSNETTNQFTLRWFTPKNEVNLCGHATLASAKVVFDRLHKHSENKSNEIQFKTKFKGTLKAVLNSSENTITLDFPLNDCESVDRKTNPWVEDIIEQTLGPELSEDIVQEVEYSKGTKKLLIKLKDSTESEKIISRVEPNFEKLLKIQTKGLVRGVIVTQKGQRVHFLSRYFSPWNGINEDPVCGSAHTVLAPYWKRQLETSHNHIDQLIGQQCSLRGGTVFCRIVGDRVLMSGKTRTVVNGVLKL